MHQEVFAILCDSPVSETKSLVSELWQALLIRSGKVPSNTAVISTQHSFTMKSLKRKRGDKKPLPLSSKVTQAADFSAAASDDDLDDVITVPAVAAGSNAYDLLLGGLERPHNVRRDMTPKSVKVKTPKTSTVGAPKQPAVVSLPAEQPLHDSDDASSSDDADDRSGGAVLEAAEASDIADEGSADFFKQHFDGSGSDPGFVGHTGPSTWTEAPKSQAPWPGTTWLTTGQPLPQVRYSSSTNLARWCQNLFLGMSKLADQHEMHCLLDICTLATFVDWQSMICGQRFEWAHALQEVMCLDYI